LGLQPGFYVPHGFVGPPGSAIASAESMAAYHLGMTRIKQFSVLGAAWALYCGCLGNLSTTAQAEPVGMSAFVQSVGDEDTGAATMRIASRAYQSADGSGPMIWLVGAVHIGEAGYYEALQGHMDGFDLLLYEGVGRPDMFEIWDSEGVEGVERTRRQLDLLAKLLRTHGQEDDASDSWVSSFDALLDRWTDKHFSLLVNQLSHARIDAWGNPIGYEVDGKHAVLTSLGSDGQSGGTGDAADLTKRVTPRLKPLTSEASTSGGGGSEISDLQLTMARSFGLTYQLHEVDYSSLSYVPSDMSARQIESAFAKVGLYMDFSGDGDGEGDGGKALLREMGGPGAGLSLGVMKMLSGFIEASPGLQQLARLMMVELLSRDDLMQMAADAMGNPGVLEVLIDQRNQVVLDDLHAVLKMDEPPEEIGIFYGAAHLPDMAERLKEQLGYEPTGQAVWFDAMTADPAATGMPPQNVEMTKAFLRRMLDQAIAQQRMASRLKEKKTEE